MENQSLLPELTPPPIPEEDQEKEEPTEVQEQMQTASESDPPTTFTSVEDLKENLNREGARFGGHKLTEPEYRSVINAMAPTIQEKYKLKTGWDGESRWPSSK